MLFLTREQVRRVDRLAIEELGIPGVVLMENAGRGAAAVILDLIRDELHMDLADARVTILCGGGNNGGDGYVIARHLHNAGMAVTIYAARNPADLAGDAAVNAAIAQRMKLPLHLILDESRLDALLPDWARAHVVVDALLGTGFTGAVRPHLRGVIERCNALSGPRIVAIDLPSGMDCDTGQASGPAIQADVTITFVAAKTGFARPEARSLLGRVVIVPIGVPPELVQRIAAGG